MGRIKRLWRLLVAASDRLAPPVKPVTVPSGGPFRIEIGPRAYTAARYWGGEYANAWLLPRRAVRRGLLELRCLPCAGEVVPDGVDAVTVVPSFELKTALALWLNADAAHLIRRALGYGWLRVHCACGAVVGAEWRE